VLLTKLKEKREMKLLTNKSLATMIALFLIFAIAASIAVLPVTKAATTRKTYSICDAVPNPVGQGQQVLIRYGIMQQLPNVAFGYSGLTVTIVKPDDTTQTLSDLKTDSTGESIYVFTPDQVGTYKITSHFPTTTWIWGNFSSLEAGDTIYEGTVLQESTSPTVNLVVQEEPLPDYPGHPLPTEYWTRPIDPQLREWYSISGNWLQRVMGSDNSIGYYNDYAPETAHVLWAKPLTTGGLTGGVWGDNIPAGSETGDAYEGKFPGSVIMNGILYYQRTDTRAELAPAIIGIDLHTGEQVFFRNNTVLSFGQILYFNSWNYDGVFTYLWESKSVMNPDFTTNTTWNAYDPFTGNWQFGFTNVPSGTRVYGPSGEILIYVIDYFHGWMALWNSTAAGHAHLGAMGPDYGSWGNSVHGAYRDASDPKAYSWNVTIPAGLQASTSFFAPVLKVYPDRVETVYFTRQNVTVWALKTEGLTKASTKIDSPIFKETWQAPAEWEAGANTIQYVGATDYLEGGVIAVWDKELRTIYGFSAENGKYLWQTEPENVWDFLGWGNAEHTWYFAYDHLYSTGVGGYVYAYNLTTGKADWTYAMEDAYNEPVTGDRWWGWIDLIADGKVYVGTVEHSAEQPIPRGAPYVCLNATTGEEIWRVNGMFRQTRWGGCGVIGDSIIATMDTYDQRVYAVGKGPSATTVTASPKVSVNGDQVLVEGMVTDISPGTEDYGLTARFPHGVPAVADANQSAWMLYVYKQFARPADVTGVDVTISVLDPNNNCYDVGTTTSDANGFYRVAFVPQVPGEYTVYATFAGSKAYYSSTAFTAISVAAAPVETAPPTPQPASMADLYFLPMSIGIIIAIVVVGLLLVLMLRKR
jgi:hypothetical protein